MQNSPNTHVIPMLKSEGFSIERWGRFISVQFLKAHRVFSTSQVNGGQIDTINYLINHQSCEGKGHTTRDPDIHKLDSRDYHNAICREIGVAPEHAALMGTAANMQYASIQSESFQELTVWAITTAGVQGNAGRAGDVATWYEGEKGYQSVHATPGTINTIVLFNCQLSPAAFASAAAMINEAKSAMLNELAVGSRYSEHLATGTGTDQYCIAAPMEPLLVVSEGEATNRKPKTWAGKHTKLGEILAKAVMDSIREALKWQNGLEPSRTRHLIHALGRFGVTETQLLLEIREQLSEKEGTLLSANFQALLHEPQVSGAAYALAAIQDRITYETLPVGLAPELLANQLALLAMAASAKAEAFLQFRSALLEGFSPSDFSAIGISKCVAKALALGWETKWK